MEINGKTAEIRVQQIANLPKPSQNTSLQTIQHGNSLSVYTDSLTTEHALKEVVRLKGAFPQLPVGFYDVLLDRIKDKGFTNQQLTDSINNLVDNFTYPVPTLANILSWDKRIKLHSYAEMCKLHDESGVLFSDYEKIRRKGKLYWVSKEDYELINRKK